jgi:hypothetical protein
LKEKNIIRFSIIIYWTFFWGLSVLDKIIPAVEQNWVGKDFFALFVKFFESIGLEEPLFPTLALAGISTIEILNFVCYLFSLVHFSKGNTALAEKWFYRGILSSVILFTLFSIGDQVFGDRFQLLEHAVFWMVLIASWATFRYVANPEDKLLNIPFSKGLKAVLFTGIVLTILTSVSIFTFSHDTFSNASSALKGEQVVEGVYKFDFPFLADRLVLQKTINAFKVEHPNLKVTYVYTGPDELNTKKKTHLLLYIFTETESVEKDAQ